MKKKKCERNGHFVLLVFSCNEFSINNTHKVKRKIKSYEWLCGVAYS